MAGDRRTEDLEDDLRAAVRPLERLLARAELEGHHALLDRDDQQEEREARQRGRPELETCATATHAHTQCTFVSGQ